MTMTNKKARIFLVQEASKISPDAWIGDSKDKNIDVKKLSLKVIIDLFITSKVSEMMTLCLMHLFWSNHVILFYSILDGSSSEQTDCIVKLVQRK